MADFRPSFYDAAARRAIDLRPLQQAAESQSAAYQAAARSIVGSVQHAREMKLMQARMDMEKTKYEQELELRKRESAAAEARSKAMEEHNRIQEEIGNKRWDAYLEAQKGHDVAHTAAAGITAAGRVTVGAGHDTAHVAGMDRMAKLNEARDAQKKADFSGASNDLKAMMQDADQNPIQHHTVSGITTDPTLRGIYGESGERGLINHFKGKGMDDGEAKTSAREAMKEYDVPWRDHNKVLAASAILQAKYGPQATADALKEGLGHIKSENPMEAEQSFLKATTSQQKADTSTPAGKGAAPPMVNLPGGGKFPDTVGFSQGGYVDDLVKDPQKLSWFQGAVQKSAQGDKRYVPQSQIDTALLSPGGDKIGAQLLQNNANVLHEHSEQFLGAHTWGRTPEAQPAGPGAPPSDPSQCFQITPNPPGLPPMGPPGATPGPMPGAAPAPDPASAMRARIQGGEFGHQGAFDQEKLDAELKKAGLTEDAVMGADGGG